MAEVITTNGATEALFSVMNGLLNPGDEVIIIEPAFDLYHAQVWYFWMW
jgi:aspartate/methionine/tyrosine aminotransferase